MEREPDIEPIAEDTAVLTMPAGPGELAAIFLGGFLGALLRAALTESLGTSPAQWPWPTFAVNLVAAGLLGYAIAWLRSHHPRTIRARAFLATGLCGALSTFSTVMIELIHLGERSGLALAVAYGAASVAGGFVAALLGIRAGAGRAR